jgi:hypothetical protein
MQIAIDLLSDLLQFDIPFHKLQVEQVEVLGDGY